MACCPQLIKVCRYALAAVLELDRRGPDCADLRLRPFDISWKRGFPVRRHESSGYKRLKDQPTGILLTPLSDLLRDTLPSSSRSPDGLR